MTDVFQDVLDFHHALDVPVVRQPAVPSLRRKALRHALVMEEADELNLGIVRDDLVEIADGCADLIYVVLGLAIEYGIDLRPIWDEVHRTNMLKQGGPKRLDDKILKPDGWVPPNVAGLIAEQLA